MLMIVVVDTSEDIPYSVTLVLSEAAVITSLTSVGRWTENVLVTEGGMELVHEGSLV